MSLFRRKKDTADKTSVRKPVSSGLIHETTREGIREHYNNIIKSETEEIYPDDVYKYYQTCNPDELRNFLRSNWDEHTYGLILRDYEHLHHIEHFAQSFNVKNQVIGHTYNSTGVSGRIMPGVSLRSSSGYSKVVRGDVKESYKGMLFVTNQRVILTAPKYGFELPIDKISNIEYYSDGIVFYKSGKAYTVLLEDDESVKWTRNTLYLITHAADVEHIGPDPRSTKGRRAIAEMAKKYAPRYSDPELYEKAITTVLTEEYCAVSLLQRRLKLDYTKAASLVDQMEEDGLVGPADGVTPRQILVKLSEK